MVCYLLYSFERNMPPLDRVPCLCSSMCYTSFPLCWAQSCATSLKLHLDIWQNALFQVTVQLFSFSSCKDIPPLLPAAPTDCCVWTVICCCCYRIHFPAYFCKGAVLLRRQPSQSAPAMVYPEHCVQACSYFTILTSVMALLSLPVNCISWISLVLPRNGFVISPCYKTDEKKYSTTGSPRAAYR